MIIDCHQCAKRHVIVDRSPQTIARCDCGAQFELKISALDTGVLKCSNCGGNPPLDASHCPYCDAHLAKLRCGRCLASSIEGDLHCRACGHLLSSPVEPRMPGPDGVMGCPRCDSPMNAIMVGDSVLDDCVQCGGVWLAHEVFKDIVQSQRDRTKFTRILRELEPGPAVALGSGITRQAPETDERFYVNCPQCGSMMDRRQFAAVSGIVVDVCRAHGVWFDHDELPRVVQFVGDGKLQKVAKTRHKQRMNSIDELQDRTASTSRHKRITSDLSSGFDAADLLEAIFKLFFR